MDSLNNFTAVPALADTLDRFLMIKEASMRSDATIAQYKSIIGAFVKALDGEASINQIDELDAIRYVKSLRTRDVRYEDSEYKPTEKGGLSYESIRTHINVIKLFTRWMSDKYNITDLLGDIQVPPPRKSEPKAISNDDFKRLIDATENSTCPQRDLAILFVLLDGMVRRQALVNMKIGDVDLARNRAKVIEKGHKLHTVRWSHYTSKVIFTWLQVRPQFTNPNDSRSLDEQPVFISLNDGANLKPGAINQLLTRLKKRAGITGRVNPHSFRHRGAITYLLAGGDLSSLGARLNHTDANTTNMYAIFSEAELQQLQNEKSPLVEILKLNHK